jgi:hypothetical protein
VGWPVPRVGCEVVAVAALSRWLREGRGGVVEAVWATRHLRLAFARGRWWWIASPPLVFAREGGGGGGVGDA